MGTGKAAGRDRLRVLVADDEPAIRQVVTSYLEHDGYDVVAVGDGLAALRAVESDHIDLVILDLALPGLSGWEVCRRLRERQDGYIPIIMVTARASEDDRVVGLELGADDYVVKPFSPRELLARVRAVLRRSQAMSAPDETLRWPGLEIVPAERRVLAGGTAVKLTAAEFDLLLTMARQPERVFARTQLLDAVFGTTYEGYERTIDSHIKNIRRKLAAAGLQPTVIETVYGAGYRFHPPGGGGQS